MGWSVLLMYVLSHERMLCKLERTFRKIGPRLSLITVHISAVVSRWTWLSILLACLYFQYCYGIDLPYFPRAPTTPPPPPHRIATISTRPAPGGRPGVPLSPGGHQPPQPARGGAPGRLYLHGRRQRRQLSAGTWRAY